MAYLHIVLVLSVLSFITYGDALKCWTCSSDLDPHCADPFNNTSPSFDLHHTLTDCNTQSSPHYSLYKTKSVCKKIKQTVNGKHEAVVRTCEWLKSEDDAVGECPPSTFNTPKYITINYCETCDTDGCNGAENIRPTVFWTALIPAALALLLRN